MGSPFVVIATAGKACSRSKNVHQTLSVRSIGDMSAVHAAAISANALRAARTAAMWQCSHSADEKVPFEEGVFQHTFEVCQVVSQSG